MDDDRQAGLRALYSAACDGLTSAGRWEARDKLSALANRAGLSVDRFLREAGLDAARYQRSCPPYRNPAAPKPACGKPFRRH